MKKYIIESISDISEIAEFFVRETNAATIFAFYGEMGVGKTTFIKEIYTVLGVIDEVTSPTFALINEYKTQNNTQLYHFDLYRIHSIEEALQIGVEDYLESGCICMIEWPEIIEPLLPEHTCRVHLQELENGKRELSFQL
ncbi:MAG: tRNA (adenosine(37)-N6)-threonylcarbamoyltransferase complex ATPase subunit type 1 TsaE [Bacteroidales bacterium]|nr:tRNA (adenosine(37)-N6)-threonylcarbamoyltransferase complex ATPase subunit type 1 TsaE [Bacteroidales bacterium]HPY81952.1 tRNA (adenosine(37)-N6)-threonylcarbamoyltransferase complex ATPase subunit type 1 TsaE [Bacteroidales bacterium]